MTARITAGLALAIVAMLAYLVTQVMAASVLAGTLLASVLIGGLMLYAAYRLIATGKGAHVAPHGWAEAGERLALPCEGTIPRAHTEHAPPWEGEHITEPTAIMPAPVPEPEPEAYWIAAGTVSDGRVTSVHVAVLPPPVEAILGHATVDDWLESAFTRAMSLQVRALTDGAP